MPLDSDFLLRLEREACRRLAVYRWGPTAWRCECGCLEGTQLTDRPRVTQCHDCRSQRSVTAGTVFAYTKLPVLVLLEAFDDAVFLPTVSTLQQDHGFARSTAWYFLHRALKVVAHAFDSAPTPPDAPELHLGVLLKSTGRAPLPSGAPAWFQDRQRARDRARVPFRLDVVGGLAQLGFLGPPAAAPDPRRAIPPGARSVRGLPRLFAFTLDRHRRVSFRWGPRWIAAMVVFYYLGGDIPEPDLGAWCARAAALGHVPRSRFEPWRAPGPWNRDGS